MHPADELIAIAALTRSAAALSVRGRRRLTGRLRRQA